MKVIESRNLDTINHELYANNFPLRIQDVLGNVAAQFDGESPLYILEGGSGYGNILGGIKDFLRIHGREAHTTGATKNLAHIPFSRDNNIDRLIVGQLEKYYRGSVPDVYHLIIDYCGAVFYDTACNRVLDGATMLPLYARLLRPGGRLLMRLDHMNQAIKYQSARETREVTRSILRIYHLEEIIQPIRSPIVFAQKI
ncbi:hypothetical protein HY389_00785 [Candidatus Daviesbacteria bacterium]|nr:hypothetical protein [Candidatus Daviesbacteria bacterium]